MSIKINLKQLNTRKKSHSYFHETQGTYTVDVTFRNPLNICIVVSSFQITNCIFLSLIYGTWRQNRSILLAFSPNIFLCMCEFCKIPHLTPFCFTFILACHIHYAQKTKKKRKKETVCDVGIAQMLAIMSTFRH